MNAMSAWTVRRFFFRFCGGAALACAAAGATAAQGHKLNAPLPRPIGGDIRGYRIDADGDRVVFVADQEADELFELYVALPLHGHLGRRKLSPELVAGGDVSAYVLLSRGPAARAVFTADAEEDERHELYSAPVAGGPIVKLNPPLVAGGDVGGNAAPFLISADGSRVLYLADQEVDGRLELFQVPIDGSAPAQRVNGPVVGGGVAGFQLSPDGTRAIYLAQQDSLGTQLYSAALDGSRAPVKLNGALIASGNVSTFAISADGARVAYRADQLADERLDLFSVPIDGGAALLLSELVGARDVLTFAIVGSHAVYRADQDVNDQFGVYSAPLDGSLPAVRLSNLGQRVIEFVGASDGGRVAYLASDGAGDHSLFTIPADGSAAPVQIDPPSSPGIVFGGFRFTPDSSRIVYQAQQDSAALLELYVAPADGSGPSTKLNPPIVAGGNLAYGFALAGNQGVVFTGQVETVGVIELFSAPLSGGSALKLSGPLVFGGDVDNGAYQVPNAAYQVSADGRRVVYVADQESDEAHELFLTPVAGGRMPLKLNESLPTGPIEGDVSAYELSRDGDWVVYLADQIENDVFELFRVAAHGSGSPERLSGALVPGGDVDAFRLSPDGVRVAYRADQDTDGVPELYVVPLDGSLPPQRLSNALAAGRIVDPNFAFSPDGVRVVYEVDQDYDGLHELYGVRADGSAAPVLLSVLPQSTRGHTFAISADGADVAFIADLSGFAEFELYAAPIDGSAAQALLSGSMTLGGDVHELTLVGTRALYVADQAVDRRNELYSVPLDGSSPAVKLNGALVAGTGVGSPVVSPDGARVLFSASMQAADRSELYGAPVDGSAPALLLTPGMPAYGRIQIDYAIAPGNTRALYRANALSDAIELFSVPLDASALPVRLNGTLIANGDVRGRWEGDVAFRVSPDGARVVYTANQDSTHFELYSAPADGSSAAVRLNGTLANSSVSGKYGISADSSTVFYLARTSFTRLTDLFRVPIAGGPSKRENARPRAVVSDFVLDRRGERVVYRAELASTLETSELFLSFLGAPHQPAATPTASFTRDADF